METLRNSKSVRVLETRRKSNTRARIGNSKKNALHKAEKISPERVRFGKRYPCNRVGYLGYPSGAFLLINLTP